MAVAGGLNPPSVWFECGELLGSKQMSGQPRNLAALCRWPSRPLQHSPESAHSRLSFSQLLAALCSNNRDCSPDQAMGIKQPVGNFSRDLFSASLPMSIPTAHPSNLDISPAARSSPQFTTKQPVAKPLSIRSHSQLGGVRITSRFHFHHIHIRNPLARHLPSCWSYRIVDFLLSFSTPPRLWLPRPSSDGTSDGTPPNKDLTTLTPFTN
ncbi:hypothetical protein B0T25DRAFT_80006 [Lasiosphaeria hispida]|uniref:Uncharacterized protein n=1 Tax=Lasiosphaeria hispida TaxID=260671 RepID=A0AAJ0HPQ3_9PEZI|nr:hypothetical protein B0T25DRAFT_80006 [Lasiosphaeria hispida]